MSRSELDPLVNQFEHESHRKRAAEALLILKKIASMVKPIMRQRNWFVGTLAEFYPAEASLLGMNHNWGQKIQLRLRHAGDETQFLPFEQVTDTMLHELSHIVHGPHDQKFHALWDQLRDEHQALVMKGYTGEGFLGKGERLGGQRLPMNEARRRARAAAEKRRTLTAGSGQRLGGRGIARGENVRSVIVDAIERRNRINEGCATGTAKGRQEAERLTLAKDGLEVTKAEQEDPNEAAIMQAYIEMIQDEERQKHGQDYVPPTESNPAGMRTITAPTVSSNLLRSQQADIESSLRQSRPPPAPSQSTKLSKPAKVPMRPPTTPAPTPLQPRQTPVTWTCEICTLVNPMSCVQCDACGIDRTLPDNPPITTNTATSKPKSVPLAWKCKGCASYVEQEWWTCPSCGRMKESS